MEVYNEYQPDNFLQRLWEGTEGTCLCTRRESCSNCDGSKRELKKIILQQAKDLNYTLYLFGYPNRKPIDMEYVTKTYNLK